MTRATYVWAAAAIATGLVAAGCSSASDSKAETTETTATTATSAATSTSAQAAPSTTGAGVDLTSLIPTPANNQRTDGPDPIQESGIHQHFLVNGSPVDVMNGYKTALEGGGWTVTVMNSGGGGGGGGATYTGTNGSAYGVFSGGGYGSTSDVEACAWPAKPANTNCGQREN